MTICNILIRIELIFYHFVVLVVLVDTIDRYLIEKKIIKYVELKC